MKRVTGINRKLLVAAVVCVLLAASIYAYAYRTHLYHYSSSSRAALVQNIDAAEQVPDGTYTSQFRSSMTSYGSTNITWSHVTYFEGDEATLSASHEISCEGKPIMTCVPTLARGYYVRPSGTPDFSTVVSTHTNIILRDNPRATVEELVDVVRTAEPVFDVAVLGGTATLISEKTPL